MFKLGEFQYFLLLCLLKRGGESSGYDLECELEEMLNRDVLAPQVIGALSRMEKKNLVSFSFSEKTEGKGRPRKVYRITKEGKDAVKEKQLRVSKSASWFGDLVGA